MKGKGASLSQLEAMIHILFLAISFEFSKDELDSPKIVTHPGLQTYINVTQHLSHLTLDNKAVFVMDRRSIETPPFHLVLHFLGLFHLGLTFRRG